MVCCISVSCVYICDLFVINGVFNFSELLMKQFSTECPYQSATAEKLLDVLYLSEQLMKQLDDLPS